MNMKAQEKIKNNEINVRSETLTDLPVPDEQVQQAKGGGSDILLVQDFTQGGSVSRR
jgi:hypothetical protein